MIQYTKAFTHVPLEDTTSAIALTSLALGALGVQDVPSTAAFTRGIRSDTYAGYVALHLIGHNDIPMQPSMWQWALQTVISTRGQPLQYLGWAAAIKLSHLSLKRDSAAQSASVIMATLFKDTLAASTTAATVSVASSTPNASVALSISVQQSSVRNGWVDFLQGVSVCHSHASSGEGNAQWTRGIAEILHSAEYLRNVFPRKMFDAKSDNNEFSSCVQAVNVGMFWSLFSLLQKAQPTLLSTAFLSQVMSASKELVFASPEEERCNNATRAELFGGLYRLVLTAPAEPRLWELDSLLTDFVTEQLEKASHEFATDYAEAIFMASVGLILPRDLKLFDLVNKGLEWVLRPPDGSVQSGDDGFTRLDNKLLLAEALLLSDNTTSVVHPGAETSFAATIATLLNASDTKVLLPYRSSRVLLSVLTSNLLLGHATQLPDMSVLWTKLRGFCAYLDADSAGDPTTMSTDAIVTDVDKLEQTRSQHALEFASNCVRSVATCAAFWRTESYLSSLVPLLLKGSGHPDLETAKMCHLTCLLIFGSAKEYLTGNGTQASAVSSGLLSYLQQCAKHSSFHVRETVATCSTLLLVGNWETMAAADRKSLKDILADGLVDDKPEVQTLARFGMVAYLCAKTGREMTTIADVYVKNSDLLAAREKAKRKSTVAGIVSVTSKAESDKNEKVYMTTIMMAACVVLTYPYDLPTFMPSLLASIVKHKSVPAMQAAVLKTVQLFKSTHQDRWEDFKVLFTNDQLTDIQGAGAAHYYS